MLGFCTEDINPFGPVQLYVAPVTVGVERPRVPPAQIGPLLLAVGVAGMMFRVLLSAVNETFPAVSFAYTDNAPLPAMVIAGHVVVYVGGPPVAELATTALRHSARSKFPPPLEAQLSLRMYVRVVPVGVTIPHN